MGDDKVLDTRDPDVQAMARKHISEQFFVDQLPPRETLPSPYLTFKEEMRALRQFTKACKRMDAKALEANITWLYRRFVRDGSIPFPR